MPLNLFAFNTEPLSGGVLINERVLTHRAGALSGLSGQLGAPLLNQAGAASSIQASLGAQLTHQAGGTSRIDDSVLTALSRAEINRSGAASSLSAAFSVTLSHQAGAQSALAGILGQYADLLNQAGALSALSGLIAALFPAITSQAGALTALSPSGWLVIASQAGAGSGLAATSCALLSLASQAGAASTAAGLIAAAAALLTRAGAQSGLSGTAHLLATAESRAGGKSHLDAGRLDVWVINLATGAVSRYTALPDCTLAGIGGRLLIAAATGLYELVGTDDAGTPIVASLTTGKLDFGTHFLKRVDSLNIGYESTGTLVLETTIAHGDAGRTDTFVWPLLAAASPRDGVVKVGKGLLSRYWQFRLTNQSGAAFKIDTLDIHPIILSRRR